MKFPVILWTLLLLSGPLRSQTESTELYLPIEYQRAYEKGTRQLDGAVPPAYWQNRAAYRLKAKVNPYKKLLTGQAAILYHNQSPDSLTQIVFHAYHDYYKAGAAKAGFFSNGYNPDLISDGMVVDLLVVEQDTIDISDRDKVSYRGTNYGIKLTTPLPPKASMNLRIDWHYTIPGKGFERSGAIDSTSMFIAYWYPEIAVLDDINAWDRLVYDASTEFYHDYSDFEVEIEVPENFVVWASTAPINASDLYPEAQLQRLAQAKKSTDPVTIVGATDWAKGLKMRSTTWRYSASDFPDFSFALSNHFIWEACQYTDDFGTYFLNSAYDRKNGSFKAVLKTQQESLRIFHQDFPAYPFPFKHFTIFNGLQGGGMEFPGMANDMAMPPAMIAQYLGIEVSEYEANLGLTLHEMCHMYFPFMMGINEKRYAWMDEGMASFSAHFQKEGNFEFSSDNSYLAEHKVAPIMVPTYTQPSHAGINSYTIGSISYYSLYYLLGETQFKKCMKGYMDTWKHKHPTPYDFMFSFNRISGQDLNWFWKRWYFDWGHPDVAIREFKDQRLSIENKGGRPLAFDIIYTYANGSESNQTISPEVWKDSSVFHLQVSSEQEIVAIQLKILGGHDAIKENDFWKL